MFWRLNLVIQQQPPPPSVPSSSHPCWLDRGTWLPADNSLTPPIREYNLPVPFSPSILSRRGSSCQGVFKCPNLDRRVAEPGLSSNTSSAAGADSRCRSRRWVQCFHAAPSQPSLIYGLERQEGCVHSHGSLSVHRISDFEAFLPGLGTVLLSDSKTVLNLSIQKHQQETFFCYADVFGHMLNIRLSHL